MNAPLTTTGIPVPLKVLWAQPHPPAALRDSWVLGDYARVGDCVGDVDCNGIWTDLRWVNVLFKRGLHVLNHLDVPSSRSIGQPSDIASRENAIFGANQDLRRLSGHAQKDAFCPVCIQLIQSTGLPLPPQELLSEARHRRLCFVALGVLKRCPSMSPDRPSHDYLRGPPGGPLEDRVRGINLLVNLVLELAFQCLELPFPSSHYSFHVTIGL